MKIIQLMTVMEAGGVQRVAYLLSEALNSRGHSCEPWFLYRKRAAYEDVAGTKVFMDRQPDARNLPQLWLRVAKALLVSKPDVLITHTYYSNVIGQLAALACRVPTRISVQHNPSYSYPRGARIVDKLCGSSPLYGVNVAVSNAVIESFHNYPKSYRQRIRLIYNGIPSPSAGAPRSAIRARFRLPDDHPVIANVGRLADQKQQALLLRVLVKLPLIHLVLVGEGELRQELETQARSLQVADRVHFLGEISAEAAHEVIGASDVFLFPSKYEAMPIALLEAMSLGVPIVASDIPANREVLSNAGILIADTDPDLYAQAIQRILDDSALAERLTLLARSRSLDFQLHTMVSGYERLFAKSHNLLGNQSDVKSFDAA
jgi:glycosyltransferase involved in cell wall biosynthesis